jgi:MFS family permease
MAGAVSIIPLETLINRNSPPERRSTNFGFYAFAMASGIALGTLIGLPLYASAPRLSFVLGGSTGLLTAAVVFALEWPGHVEETLSSAVPVGLGRHLLSFGSAWSQGFLEGGMIALLPVYLLARGLSDVWVGWVMSGTMIGVICAQVPVAWLADRLGRTGVLLGCYLVTAGTLAALLLGVPFAAMALCLFFAGAASSAFYPLGLALLGERIPPSGLARANAWFLGINCLGSLIGPVLAGLAMDRFGNQALFAAALGAVLVVLVICAARYFLELMWRAKRRAVSLNPNSVEKQKAA